MKTQPDPGSRGAQGQRYKYYDLVMATFVTVLVCSNVIGAAKVATLWEFTFGAGVLFLPISYIFNDVLTVFQREDAKFTKSEMVGRQSHRISS